ncbi:MAG: YfhO family protein, partial [Candidatus Eremiobacteraeota bacterium]|nr:YfhO family protein [Candidatus Eremiobacteraeota bacterium]
QSRAAAYYFIALGSGLLAFVSFSAVAARAARNLALARERLYGGLAVLAVAAELSLNYFVPMYYFVDPGPAKIQNPYLGAAYLDYLHDETHANGKRIYAEKTSVLHPDWAQAFDLQDIRDNNAIYDDHYLPFSKAFIPKENLTDLTEDFSGTGDYSMATPIGQKFLALGSVGYIIAHNMLDPTSLGAQIERSIAASKNAAGTVAVGPSRFGTESLDGFAQTQASPALTFAFDVPKNSRSIAVALAAQETFWSVPAAQMTFTVRIFDMRGVSRTLLSRRLDSRIAGARGVLREELDVRRYAGMPVRLSFDIRASHAAAAIAGFWGDIRTESAPGEPSPFALARHFPDINIFSFARPLPHGALYEHVTIASDDPSALSALVDPGFDIYGDAVVSGDSVPKSLSNAVAGLSRQPPAPVRAATLKASSATDVSYVTAAKKPTLLFLSDTWYPGWKAFVDSQPTPILRANYLFRGVVVPPGNHAVEFRYEPRTFRTGLLLCVCGLLSLLAFSVLSKRASGPTSRRLRRAARGEA